MKRSTAKVEKIVSAKTLKDRLSKIQQGQRADMTRGDMSKVLGEKVKDTADRRVTAELTGRMKNLKFYLNERWGNYKIAEKWHIWLTFQMISFRALWWINYKEVRAEAEILKSIALTQVTDDGDWDQDGNCVVKKWWESS